MKTEAPIGAQLQEALVMASMVSLRNDLSVELGEWWAFNWQTNCITIPRRELETCPEERIAWIILHEAAHAALTRIQDILPPGFLERQEIHMLINAVEDVRIEEWLVERFPGAARWREVCRAVDAEQLRTTPRGEIDEAFKMREFLYGIFAMAEGKPLHALTPAPVVEALEQIREPLSRAVACRPPADTCGHEMISGLYALHPVALCYQAWDLIQEPEPHEKWARIMQASAWFHIAEGILPAYLRLLELPPLRSLPIGAFGRQIVHGTSAGKRSPEEMRRELRRQLAGLNAGPYHKAVRENQQHIRRVSALLAELLPNHRGLRHRRGFRSGDRIDLRIAAQSEADRRLFDKLWIRRNRRTLPDPAFVLVMDRSGSMKGPTRSGAAFASLVVVREACTRNGIPFAVIAFNNCATLLHPWDHQDDERAQAALGLVQNAEGGTDLADALELAGKVIAPRPEKDRFVLVMTDGEIFPAEAKRVHRIKQDLENTGVHFAAIGVDIEAETFHQFFPGAPLLRDCAQLPSVLGDLLVRVQLGL